MTSSWTHHHIPSQAGRTAVVTGANSGLGLETARALAAAGAHVVLAVRDPAKGEAAAADLRGSTEVRRLDLADLASVREFAAGWSGPLDVLVNNAGVMWVPAGETVDGFESHLGTNHLGPFALTNLLLPHLTDRVVTVSSSTHLTGRVELDDLHWRTRPYSPTGAYAASKLANLLFTLELQRRLTAAGSRLRALAAHPGYSATNLQSHTGSTAWNAVMSVANRVVATSSEQGALPTLFAATLELPGGSYAGPSKLGGTRGRPTLVGRSPAASDPDLAAGLWAASAELTGVDFPVSLPA
jgi:NAD(P)-dependent dehydrogenase (short-subunit alcohol dehydrogenase family)